MIFLGSSKTWNQVFKDNSHIYLQIRAQSYNLSYKSIKKHQSFPSMFKHVLLFSYIMKWVRL